MCGRFTLQAQPQDLIELFELDELHVEQVLAGVNASKSCGCILDLHIHAGYAIIGDKNKARTISIYATSDSQRLRLPKGSPRRTCDLPLPRRRMPHHLMEQCPDLMAALPANRPTGRLGLMGEPGTRTGDPHRILRFIAILVRSKQVGCSELASMGGRQRACDDAREQARSTLGE